MTLFASRENSPAEQRAIEQLIVDTFDAVDVTPRGLGGAAGPPDTVASSVPNAPPESPARPNWDQPVLWENVA